MTGAQLWQRTMIAFTRRHLEAVAAAVGAAAGSGAGVQALTLDMEDRSIVDHTFGLHDALARRRAPVMPRLQANLERTAQDLAAQVHSGARTRLYVPFGRDWWPYTARRVGETPANALLLARSLIG